ncbi:hypothetical protein A0H81_03221 [Grifola frondosa]|uniref:Fungal-type protein kinase domain-containing protein n=1 Tax=Grifola frondosa TaxID=5627 RepID=A0A1C7MJX4_GRIFR|nr:hypothetical protein A0H81_03221 [Grifola frondosa]
MNPPRIQGDVQSPPVAAADALNVQASEESSKTNIDEHFLENHLSRVPSDCSWSLPSSDNKYTKAIKKGGTVEAKIYGPLCSLLSCISERIFGYIKYTSISCYHPNAIVFIDHHHNALQHFPKPEVRDKPDLIGVYEPTQQYSLAAPHNGRMDYKSVPYHLTQTLVEAKPTTEDGRAQAASYAWQHLQARPDHPGVYVLTAKPQYYQVVWSDPSGTVASARTPWNNLRLLACYIYSLYCPPDDHVLHDLSIDVEGAGGDPFAAPEWTITSGGHIYEHCHIKFVGQAWGRRTTVFETPKSMEEFAIIKEYYRDDKRRYEEDKLIEEIHSEGLFPGVVRLISTETVTIQSDDSQNTLEKNSKKASNSSSRKACRVSSVPKPIATARQVSKEIVTARGKKDEERTVVHRTKRRLVMGSRGESLLRAKSVHDLLKAIYDILEVHRNVAMKRDGKCIMGNPPKFIDDLLGVACKNPAQADHARCLMIDLDNAAKLLKKSEQPETEHELACRTGTPVYIARSVSAGAIWNLEEYALSFSPMPELSKEAAKVYFKSRSERHQYDDNTPGWCHGSPVPTDISEMCKAREWIKFRHRMEHDAESIFWTLISVILRAQPQDVPVEEEPSRVLLKAWNALQNHEIDAMAESDSRDYLLLFMPANWEHALLPEMRSLGRLLYNLARQVRSEYALLKDQAVPEDHLHEAMQRLIFEYLWESEDIDLNPDVLRPVGKGDQPGKIPRISTAKRSQPDQGGREEPKRRRSGQEKSKRNVLPIVFSFCCAWSDLTFLACFLYSLYCPPEGHVLHDMSITVEGTGGNPLAPPEWTITSGHQIYEHCHIKYVGHALGRRTTVFETPKSVEEFAIIKEYYRDDKHLYEEDKLIEGIHSEGLFPGVVRLISSKTVTIQRNDANATLQKDSKVSNVSFKKARRFSSTPKPIATSRQAKKDKELTVVHRTKRRLVMGSRGESLRRAKNVHDLLKAIYDILEVHRNVAMKRGVLHRDMSLHNILMYPEHREIQGKCIMENPPKFIDDLLGIASKNSAQADHSRCLMIDLDNATKLLKSEQSQIDDELTCRIGTPVYIARSVSAGAIWNLQDHALSFSHMPELSEQAAKVYFESHPTRRQYDDNIPGWCRGSPVPTDISTLYDAREWIKFRHRMEHDAESIFWTLVSVILRVQPQDARMEEEPSRILSRAWNALQDHQIATMALTDSRDYFFDLNVPVWEATLLPEMKSLGRLLYDLARQVRSEYALLEDQAVPEDHLHEAMQRLIFEYLLKSEDIDLNPDVLRPVVEKVWVHVPERAPRVSTAKRSRPDQGGRDEPKRRRAGQEKSLKRGRREEARRRRSGQKKHNASGIETTKI